MLQCGMVLFAQPALYVRWGMHTGVYSQSGVVRDVEVLIHHNERGDAFIVCREVRVGMA